MPYEMFSKFRHAKDGLKPQCKPCVRLHRIKTKDARALYDSRYKAEHKERAQITGAAYREKNRDKINSQLAVYRQENRELLNAKRAAYCAANPDRIRQIQAKHDSSNREKRRASAAAWAAANRDKVLDYRKRTKSQMSKRAAEWALMNPERRAAIKARRRSSEMQATPKWAHEEDFSDFYLVARMFRMYTGLRYEVDHIVPLQHDLVCGLHCEANLQVILLTENRSKSNRWWPDMP